MTHHRPLLSAALPDFPWDSIAEDRERAKSHPDGLVDLSVGSPVDPVAPSIQLALSESAAEPGYPTTAGTPELVDAIVESLSRRYGVEDLSTSAVLPVVGTKEAIAWLPTLLGLGRGELAEATVIIPPLAYPTYEVGARLAGVDVVRSENPARDERDLSGAGLIYLNSPSNPTGKVLEPEVLEEIVSWARENDVVVASDECYLGLNSDQSRPARSILDPAVSGGSVEGLIAIHSLSKTSNLAGYRAGFFAGDEELIAELRLLRKHAGLIVPGPIQAAMVAALNDDDQEHLQKLRYANRRADLARALGEAGLAIADSTGGLYLWATRGESGRDTVSWLADLGIIAAPGDFYGPDGERFVRFSLTATDEAISEAYRRLSAAK